MAFRAAPTAGGVGPALGYDFSTGERRSLADPAGVYRRAAGPGTAPKPCLASYRIADSCRTDRDFCRGGAIICVGVLYRSTVSFSVVGFGTVPVVSGLKAHVYTPGFGQANEPQAGER